VEDASRLSTRLLRLNVFFFKPTNSLSKSPTKTKPSSASQIQLTIYFKPATWRNIIACIQFEHFINFGFFQGWRFILIGPTPTFWLYIIFTNLHSPESVCFCVWKPVLEDLPIQIRSNFR